MYDPFPLADSECVILRNLEVIHRHGARNSLQHDNGTGAASSFHHMHPYTELGDRYKALFHGKERMLLVGMHHLAGLLGGLAMLSRNRRRNGHIDKIVIVVDP